MGNIKEINIKRRTYYFFNKMINIEDFDSSLLEIDNKSYKNIGIYNIGYIKIKKIDDYENIHCENPLYLMIGKKNGYTKENDGNKYLVFDSEIFKKCKELWDGAKNGIETINVGTEGEYSKGIMKIKFDTVDGLSLSKTLKFPTMTIVVRSVSEEDSKYYPQVYLDLFI